MEVAQARSSWYYSGGAGLCHDYDDNEDEIAIKRRDFCVVLLCYRKLT